MSSKGARVTELSTLIPCWWPSNNQWCWNLTDRVVLLEEDGGQNSLQILTDLGEYLAVDRVTPEEWVHLRDAAVQSHCCLTAHHLELLVCCFSILVEHTQQALLAIVDGLLNYWGAGETAVLVPPKIAFSFSLFKVFIVNVLIKI